MAIYKEIRQSSGVVASYHRILYINITTNRQNSIALVSYADETARQNEKANDDYRPFVQAKTYELPYNEAMTITSAYEYLKTLPEFTGATDI